MKTKIDNTKWYSIHAVYCILISDQNLNNKVTITEYLILKYPVRLYKPFITNKQDDDTVFVTFLGFRPYFEGLRF